MKDRRTDDRRKKDRRKDNRGVVDRRGVLDRRNNSKEKDYQKEEKIFDDQLEGRNSVLELLESGKDINKIFITKGEKHGSINKIIAKAKENKIIIVEKERRKIEEMSQTQNCQGVIAIVPPYEYCEVEDIYNMQKINKKMHLF